MMKKGSLQLSVGAIITLIIAVAVLGLVISFVATQFSFFSGRIALQEDTPGPDARNQITFPGDRTSLTLEKSQEYEMIIKVYNPSPDAYEYSEFDLDCNKVGINATSIVFSAPNTIVGAGQIGEIATLVEAQPTAPLGRAACTLTVRDDDATTGGSSRSVFIEVE